MEYNKRSVTDIDVTGKKVLLRCDFNIPLDKATGEITDEGRIVASLKTIEYLLENGAAVIACSHLGRPKGEWDTSKSLAVVAKRLSELLDMPVKMAKDVIGPDAQRLAAELRPGEIMLLENLRFHKEEEANDPDFSKALASMADIYVSDSFGTAHRAHASTAGVAAYLPAVSGFLLAKELQLLGGALTHPLRPFVAIIGGSKVSDKIGVISSLLDKTDTLILGGGMAYTFIKAAGGRIGNSLCEDNQLEFARQMMAKAKANGVKLLLPPDSVAAQRCMAGADPITVDSDAIPEGMMGLDIGPATVKKYKAEILRAGTVLWNGPMGVFEIPEFSEGTKAVADAMAMTTALTIIGGGDSVAAARQCGCADRITLISTGGGASLEFLEGIELPGVACLMDRRSRKTFVVGNLKLNKLASEMPEYAAKVEQAAAASDWCKAIVCTSPVLLSAAKAAFKSPSVGVGVQNVSEFEKGAYTGEVSALQLADIGAEYVIIGHSERRRLFGEDDATVNKKLRAALKNGLRPILCVGETAPQRANNVTYELLALQVKAALSCITDEEMSRIIIAYEPVWAIGTGTNASADDAEAAAAHIRSIVKSMFGSVTAKELPILYGGSMNETNAASYFAQPDINGGLIGEASLDPARFSAIISAANQ